MKTIPSTIAIIIAFLSFASVGVGHEEGSLTGACCTENIDDSYIGYSEAEELRMDELVRSTRIYELIIEEVEKQLAELEKQVEELDEYACLCDCDKPKYEDGNDKISELEQQVEELKTEIEELRKFHTWRKIQDCGCVGEEHTCIVFGCECGCQE